MDDPWLCKQPLGSFTKKLRLVASLENVNSHWVSKNQETARFFKYFWDGIQILKNFISEIKTNICLCVSEPTAKITPYALHHQIRKHVFLEENGKTSLQKESVKHLRYTDEFLSSTNDYYVKVASYM